MQIILADAKIMRAEVTIPPLCTTTPLFQSEATVIAEEMAKKSVADIAKLFSCSPAIAVENHQRFLSFSGATAQPALLAYFGQAYKYLQADDFSQDDFSFAQDHVLTMSFLYGLLRPLDLIHLYRMPANVRLDFTDGKPLQTWWRGRLTDILIKRVRDDDGILLDLATTEFERMCDWKKVEEQVTVIKPLFLVDKGMEYKTVSMYAKGCRGAMTRFVVKNRISLPQDLRDFSIDDFCYRADLGDEQHPHYIKEEQD